MTTKGHLACDGPGRPPALLLTAGRRHRGVCARPLLERIRVPRAGRCRPRCRPDHVIADKAYASRGFRSYLRKRGIGHAIPQYSVRAPAQRLRGSMIRVERADEKPVRHGARCCERCSSRRRPMYSEKRP
ncbi:transposase [Streptomyces flaveolus]|uniref:transposase n=1 Tax=Streptomyces flaveolus TaxID=67297 RepID=UPI003433829C